MNLKIITTSAFGIVLSFSAFGAAMIDIQFKRPTDGLYTGTGATGEGTTWNAFTGNSSTSLLNLQTETGSASAVDLTATFLSRFGGSSTSGSTPNVLLGAGLYGTASFTFSDLTPTDTFSLYIYVGNKAEIATTVTISTPGGSTKTPSPVQNQSSFALDGNYVMFSGLTPNNSNQISGSISGSFTAVNGLQLQTTTVPEPTTTLLIGLAFFVWLVRRPINRRGLTPM